VTVEAAFDAAHLGSLWGQSSEGMRVQTPSPDSHDLGTAEIETDLVGARVLVIDDSNTIRRSAEIFLRQGGHEVLLAEDGFDALSKISDHDPELIFCDILMPRLDGYQTCAIIKRNPRFAHVPVIMLSSKDGLFDKARGRMVGSQDYLTKPFTKEQLLRAVEDYRRTAFPSEEPSSI
jgi:twitching motility two-component system response regulator PilG